MEWEGYKTVIFYHNHDLWVMTMVWMDVWDSCGLTSDVGVPLAHLIIPPASDTWSIIFSSCPSVCPSALLTNHWPTDQMTDHPFIYPERFLGIFCGIKVRKGHFLPLCLSETGQILVFQVILWGSMEETAWNMTSLCMLTIFRTDCILITVCSFFQFGCSIT